MVDRPMGLTINRPPAHSKTLRQCNRCDKSKQKESWINKYYYYYYYYYLAVGWDMVQA